MSICEISLGSPPAVTAPRQRRPAAPAPLPDIVPGQVWLVEMPAIDGALSTPLRRVLEAVNVVIYDRGLAERLAKSLPLGSYAEPAAANRLGDAAASRSVRFARDGWSVVRLVPARPAQRERGRRVRNLVEELLAAKVAGGIAVSIMTDTDGIADRVETRLDRLAEAVAAYPRDARLLIAIGAFDAGAAPRLRAVAANGLAG